MPFLALLKLVSPREWLWIAALALVGFLAWRIYAAGEHRIEAKDAALRAAAVALNKASEQLADLKEISIERTYTHIVDAPPVANVGLLCHSTVATVKPGPAKSGGSANNGTPDVLPTREFDPSGALLSLLRAADAQVNALIDRDLELEALLQGVTK
jgi:hypothetical protein